MAKDITLKTRNGETRYPKSVTALIFENATGKTLQTIIDEMRQVDSATDTRTQHFKADVNNLDTLKNKTDIGLYNYVGTGWRGSVSVCYDSADNVSQVALSSSTPSYNGNTLTWLSAQPCAMARTYTNGAWSHWEKVGAPVVNDLTTGGTDKALSAEMGKTLKEGLDALGPKIEQVKSVFNPADKTIRAASKNTFYVADGEGNVIAKIDSSGLSVVSAKIKDSNQVLKDLRVWIESKVDSVSGKGLSTEDFTTELKSKLEELNDTKNIKDDTLGTFYLCDEYGKVIFKVDANGVYTTAVHCDSIKKLNGDDYVLEPPKGYEEFELFSLGDSLSSGGSWQAVVADKTGCVFVQAKNVKAGSMLSVGGTLSFGEGFDCMPWRAKNLIDEEYIEGTGSNAIIILENVNDGAREFDKTAKSFNLSAPIEGYSYDDFDASLLNSIPSESRILDACFRLTKTGIGKNLAITSLPTREGDVCLYVGWAGPGRSNYYIHVVPQATEAATRQYILDKILEYNYTGITDVLADNGTSVNFSNGQTSAYPVTLQFTDTDNTGMTVSITDVNDAKTSVAKYFIGESLSDWTDTSKWKDGLTYSEGWKTTIEMLQRAYPDAHIIVSLFPMFGHTAADYLLPDGTYDTNEFYNSQRLVSMRTMRTNLGAIAEFYCVPFMDVLKDCGITISNLLQFYNSTANVHPKQEGYVRFGETIATKIKHFV